MVLSAQACVSQVPASQRLLSVSEIGLVTVVVLRVIVTVALTRRRLTFFKTANPLFESLIRRGTVLPGASVACEPPCLNLTLRFLVPRRFFFAAEALNDRLARGRTTEASASVLRPQARPSTGHSTLAPGTVNAPLASTWARLAAATFSTGVGTLRSEFPVLSASAIVSCPSGLEWKLSMGTAPAHRFHWHARPAKRPGKLVDRPARRNRPCLRDEG